MKLRTTTIFNPHKIGSKIVTGDVGRNACIPGPKDCASKCFEPSIIVEVEIFAVQTALCHLLGRHKDVDEIIKINCLALDHLRKLLDREVLVKAVPSKVPFL